MFLGDDPGAEALAAKFLLKLATTLEGSERHLVAVRSLHSDQPRPGSSVAMQLQEDDTLGTGDLRRPVLDAFGFTTLGLIAAGDHLALLAKGIAPPPHAFATTTLARQAVEVSARSWYLLDPDITALRRASRFTTELLYSQWESEQQGLPLASGRSREDVVAQLTRWATHHKLEVKKGRQGFWVQPDERPRAHAIVKQMMGDLSPGYGIYSAVSHGTVGGLVDLLEAEAGPDDIGGHIQLSVSQIVLLVTWTLHGFLTATGRYFEMHGWSDDMTDDWRSHALRTAHDIGEALGLFGVSYEPEAGSNELPDEKFSSQKLSVLQRFGAWSIRGCP